MVGTSAAELANLPTELLTTVFSSLAAADLASAESTCKKWLAATSAGAWDSILRRDFPEVSSLVDMISAERNTQVPSSLCEAGSRWRYRVAASRRTCSRCHGQYCAGSNTVQAAKCGYHPGVIISGHRDNGMRARWTCCGQWGPTRAGGLHGPEPTQRSLIFCAHGQHVASLPGEVCTPNDVANQYFEGQRHNTIALTNGGSVVEDSVQFSEPAVPAVAHTLVEETMVMRKVGLAGVSWL